MKTTFAISALLSSALAAPFQLVVSKASSNANELLDRAVVFQTNTLFVGRAGRHSVNFNGADGALSIQNGDPIYVSSNGQLKIREYEHDVPRGGLTEGFTTTPDNTLKWAQGNTYVCPAKMEFSYGDPDDAIGIFAERSGAQLPDGCVQITLKKAAI
ncbi:hypothetical protein ACHAPT_012143 [Fusarium lateritium]